MKIHDRSCLGCGETIEGTRTRADKCHKCNQLDKNEVTFAADRKLLESMYSDVDGPSEPNKNNKREWTFTHQECGTRQTWVIGNVKNKLKLSPITPCSNCGKLRR